MTLKSPSAPGANRDPVATPQGIWGAVLLPLDARGEIDWHALADEVETLCLSSLAGIYTNGSAGEFHTQTEAEFDKITGIVSQIARNTGKPFQIGVSCTNPRVARARLRRVAALRPMAVQFSLPDWWPPSTDEITRFVKGMQQAGGDTPLVIYNPPHAKVRLSIEQIADLRCVAPGLVGAKLGGGDADWYRKRRQIGDGFSVFVPGHSVAFGRPLGADGSYSNVACLSPDGAVRLWNLVETDPAAARAIETRIQQFLHIHVMGLAKRAGLSDPALDKMLAAAGGWGPVGPALMWPYSSATQEAVRTIAQVARQDLPELFENDPCA